MKPAAEACDGLAAIAAHPFDRFLCGVNPPSVGAPVQIHVDRAGGHGRLPAFGAEVLRINLNPGHRARPGTCLPKAEPFAHLPVQALGDRVLWGRL